MSSSIGLSIPQRAEWHYIQTVLNLRCKVRYRFSPRRLLNDCLDEIPSYQRKRQLDPRRHLLTTQQSWLDSRFTCSCFDPHNPFVNFGTSISNNLMSNQETYEIRQSEDHERSSEHPIRTLGLAHQVGSSPRHLLTNRQIASVRPRSTIDSALKPTYDVLIILPSGPYSLKTLSRSASRMRCVMTCFAVWAAIRPKLRRRPFS